LGRKLVHHNEDYSTQNINLTEQANTEDFKVESFSYQKQRVKQYLEEMFVRHIEFENL
jgi:hypothetical protein